MPRPPRIDVPGLPQHLVARGHNKSACFARDLDRAVFLKYLRESAHAFQCDLHAFVLMTNHVHLLATGRKEGALSCLMQHAGRRYCRYVNRAYSRTGAIYEGRFRSSLVESEGYFLACMRYIELNPVRAGIVAHPRDYAWSSYRDNATGQPGDLLVPHAEYLRLGADRPSRSEAYRKLIEQPLEPGRIGAIRRAAMKNGVLGASDFQRSLEIELGRSVAIVGPGRPRNPPQKVI